jgi:uncharacterized protein (DUF58 family)
MMRRFLFYSFGVGLRLKDWLVRRFTAAGHLILAALVVAAVFGLDTNRTMAFQAFTFLISLIIAAALWSLLFRGRFRVERSLPRFATVDEPFSYRLRVFNRTGRPWSGLRVAEDLSDRRPELDALARTSDPVERERNAFDRKVGYYRWKRLVALTRGARTEERALPTLAPGGGIEAALELRPLRRGPLRLDRLLISRTDPFGLVKSYRRVSAPGTVTVLPKRYPLPDLGLSGHRHYQPGGVALASSVGDSDEFTALRDYRPGDPLRRIHWKSWAKTDRPIVKEHQDEFFVRHALVLDTFQGGGSDEAFEEAVSVASSFACTVMTQESLLDLMFVGTEAYVFTAGRGLSHTEAMLEILASVSVCRDKQFSTLPPLVLRRASMLSGCILVLIDWDEERAAFVEKLKGRGLPLAALVVTEKPGPEGDRPDGVFWLKPGRIEEDLARIGRGF